MTPSKSSTPITKGQKVVDYMQEHQPKSLNNSKLDIKSWGFPGQEATVLLGKAAENAERLTAHAWVQGRLYDADAKEHASKALRFPAGIQYKEAKQWKQTRSF